MFPSIDNGDFSVVPLDDFSFKKYFPNSNKLITLLVVFEFTRHFTPLVFLDLFDKLSAILKEAVEPFSSCDDGTGLLLPFLIDVWLLSGSCR